MDIEVIIALGVIGLASLAFFIIKRSQQKEQNSVMISSEIKEKAKISLSSSEELFKQSKKNGIVNREIVQENKPILKTNPMVWKETEEYKVEEESSDKIENIKSDKPLILVVDDSMVIRKKLNKLLSENNYTVITKNDGFEAFSYLTNNNITLPNLVISDIDMPNMDGIKLVEAVRNDKNISNIPIMFISGNVDLHFNLLSEGTIQGFMPKSSADNELLEQIDYLINNV